jgi:hypothetical protein
MTLRYEDDAMLWVMIKVPVLESDTPAKLARLLAESSTQATAFENESEPEHNGRPSGSSLSPRRA